MASGRRIFNLAFSAADPLRVTFLVLTLVSCGAADAPAVAPSTPAPSDVAQPAGWSTENTARLLHWARTAPHDALPVPDTRPLETAIGGADKTAIDKAAIDKAATALALELGRLHLLGAASSAARAGWRIADTDNTVDLDQRLHQAVVSNNIDGFFAALDPQHPDYAVLRDAYAAEKDPVRRRTIALNMERWRWMPQSLGASYVLVNTAAFEGSLWRNGKREGTWRVIVGKPSTPSPVFATRITSITFNPWWDIPASIVREKQGKFPASQGYVHSGNGWRQRPGPRNSLGQMKLVMPNPYHVYLHDTPSKSLFAQDMRAFSHGCIRVQDPLDLAVRLLDGSQSRVQVDNIVKGGQTTTVPLPSSLPVYVTYFTAAVRGDGTLAIMPDIYRRDDLVWAEFKPGTTECSAGPGTGRDGLKGA